MYRAFGSINITLRKKHHGIKEEIPQIVSSHMSLGVHVLNCDMGLITSSLVLCESQVK